MAGEVSGIEGEKEDFAYLFTYCNVSDAGILITCSPSHVCECFNCGVPDQITTAVDDRDLLSGNITCRAYRGWLRTDGQTDHFI